MPPRPKAPPVPPSPRRRRRAKRRLVLLTLVVAVCALAIVRDNYPGLWQYPVSANLPATFSDLTRRDDSDAQNAADKLAAQLKDDGANADQVFTGIYGDGNGKRVTVFGVTGWRWVPGHDVTSELDHLADRYGLGDAQSFDVGQFDVHEACAVGRDDGTSVVVCAWADHGSLATVLLTRRNLTDSAALVQRLRGAVLSPAKLF